MSSSVYTFFFKKWIYEKLMPTLNELYGWMKRRENGQLEFKEAKNGFDITKLVRYCCAFANEGSGRIILGITDQLPRKIVGSQAFLNLDQIKSHLIRILKLSQIKA